MAHNVLSLSKTNTAQVPVGVLSSLWNLALIFNSDNVFYKDFPILSSPMQPKN